MDVQGFCVPFFSLLGATTTAPHQTAKGCRSWGWLGADNLVTSKAMELNNRISNNLNIEHLFYGFCDGLWWWQWFALGKGSSHSIYTLSSARTFKENALLISPSLSATLTEYWPMSEMAVDGIVNENLLPSFANWWWLLLSSIGLLSWSHVTAGRIRTS